MPYLVTISGASGSAEPFTTLRLMLGSSEKGATPLYTQARTGDPEEHITWKDWSGGFGHKWESDAELDRYFYALGVDASIGGQLVLGPSISTLTPGTTDSTNGVVKFFEMEISGTNTLFALVGRYVLYRVNDTTWSVSKDLGSGKAGLDVVTWKHNASGATKYAYVAMGDGAGDYIWYYDAASATTTWTQHASLQALAFAKIGRELYRGHDVNYVSRVDTDTDPQDANNWSAPHQFRAGDRDQPITRLAQNAAGTLVIFKRGSMHYLQPDGSDIQMYAGLTFVPSAENGKYAYLWENDLYATYGDTHFRLGPGLEYDPIGPERMPENDSEVRGVITAGVGTDYAAYAGLYNRDTGNSYLMKLGAWRISADGIVHRDDFWHGSLSAAFASKKITAMFVSAIGAASNHKRVYMGFSDGSLAWFTLPCVPNPTACTSYDFIESTVADAAFLQMSQSHLGAPQHPKHLHGIAVDGQNFTSSGSNRKAVLTFDTNALGASFAALGTGDFDTTPGERQDFTTDTVRTQLSWRIGLRQTAAAATGETPRLTSVTLEYATRMMRQRVWSFIVLVDDGVRNRSGVRSGFSATQIKTELLRLVDTKGSVLVTFPDEVAVEMAIIGYEETVAWDPRTGGWGAGVKLTAAETAKGVLAL